MIPYKSIAVFRLSALGDVLMFLPTVRALQRNFPETKITWIISKPAFDLVRTIEEIEFIVIDKPNSPTDYWRLKKLFQHRTFDVLIAAQASFRAHTIIPLIKARQKIGYDKIRGQELHSWVVNEQIPFRKVHTLEGFMQFAEYLGARDLQVEWSLTLDCHAKIWVTEKKQEWGVGNKLVLINPAASKSERSWHAQGYIEVIKHLQAKLPVTVVLCGGPGKHDRWLADAIMQEVAVIDLVGKTTLPQLLALIAAADLLLCPDTGPSHMAAAVNTPVIALHAVTRPEISGPYGQLDKVISKYEEAKKAFARSKKQQARDWFDKNHHPEVMHLITAQDVIARL